MSDYRVEFSVLRRLDDSGDFEEIGFGSSSDHEDIDACGGDVDSIVQNRIWETTADMPDPEDIDGEYDERERNMLEEAADWLVYGTSEDTF